MKTECLDTRASIVDAVTSRDRRNLSFSSLLRGLGGLVVVAAFSVFLFQRWEGGSDITHYYLLLGHTVMLTLAGFASGRFMRQTQAARRLWGWNKCWSQA